MGRAILLTGPPGSGKTTVIRRLVAQLRGQVGGFYTQEVRQSGVRQGFEIITLDGRRGLLAHVDIRGGKRVGKYGVNLADLDGIGVRAIREALASSHLVVIDEIGPMEIASPRFCQAVLEVLDSHAILLGTIVQRSTPFTDAVKRRPEVTLIEVTPANRDALPEKILMLLE